MAATFQTGDFYPYNSPVLTGGSGISITSDSSWSSVELNLPDNKDFQEVQARLCKIEERLAILRPNEELQKRFPALQEAYEHYKLIEKLVNDQAKIHE